MAIEKVPGLGKIVTGGRWLKSHWTSDMYLAKGTERITYTSKHGETLTRFAGEGELVGVYKVPKEIQAGSETLHHAKLTESAIRPITSTWGKLGGALSSGISKGTSTLAVLTPQTVCARIPIWGAVCEVTARITFGIFVGLDMVFTTLPYMAMVSAGHNAAMKIREEYVSCYPYIGESTKLYADPPNCMPEVQVGNVLWEHLTETEWTDWGDRFFKVIDLLFGGATFKFPQPVCNPESKTFLAGQTQSYVGEGKTCSEVGAQCPNYYISAPSKDFNKLLGDEKGQFSSISKMIEGGATLTACSLVGIAEPLAGMGCYFLFYGKMIAMIQIDPSLVVEQLFGGNIFPHTVSPLDPQQKSYYYIEFPDAIHIEKVYNYETGESDMSLEGEI